MEKKLSILCLSEALLCLLGVILIFISFLYDKYNPIGFGVLGILAVIEVGLILPLMKKGGFKKSKNYWWISLAMPLGLIFTFLHLILGDDLVNQSKVLIFLNHYPYNAILIVGIIQGFIGYFRNLI